MSNIVSGVRTENNILKILYNSGEMLWAGKVCNSVSSSERRKNAFRVKFLVKEVLSKINANFMDHFFVTLTFQ